MVMAMREIIGFYLTEDAGGAQWLTLILECEHEVSQQYQHSDDVAMQRAFCLTCSCEKEAPCRSMKA